MKKYLTNLKRPLWSPYCTLPSYNSVRLKDYPDDLTPEIMLRYTLVYLTQTINMNTKFGHKILLELNKENGMVTQIPNDSYGMLISPLKKNTRILLLKQQDKYSWNSENVPNHIEKLVENAFEWYIKLKQKYNRISDITIEMIINGTI